MNIEEFVKKEAPSNDAHDWIYADWLRTYYDRFKDCSLEQLQHYQKLSREEYDSSHSATAVCMMLYELIKEKKANGETNP